MQAPSFSSSPFSPPLLPSLPPPLLTRLTDWLFTNVQMDSISDDTRAVFLRGLCEVRRAAFGQICDEICIQYVHRYNVDDATMIMCLCVCVCVCPVFDT